MHLQQINGYTYGAPIWHHNAMLSLKMNHVDVVENQHRMVWTQLM